MCELGSIPLSRKCFDRLIRKYGFDFMRLLCIESGFGSGFDKPFIFQFDESFVDGADAQIQAPVKLLNRRQFFTMLIDAVFYLFSQLSS